MKTKHVVFLSGGGAKIFINGDVAELAKLGRVVNNPDLTNVAHCPPEHWKLDKDMVVMDNELKDAYTEGAKILVFRRRKRRKWLKIAASIMLALILAVIAKGVLK